MCSNRAKSCRKKTSRKTGNALVGSRCRKGRGTVGRRLKLEKLSVGPREMEARLLDGMVLKVE